MFQNKMRSSGKPFVILSGRREKGEAGKWTDVLVQRKRRPTKEKGKLCSVNAGFGDRPWRLLLDSGLLRFHFCILLKKIKGNVSE